jgi:large subunit ribosomal protein L10
MSKQIKQMEMDALKQAFQGVREFVVLNVNGLSCHQDNQLRSNLRKKNIRVQMVKNSLARRVFGDLGLAVPHESPYWQGTTWMAWGRDSVAELSKELDGLITKNNLLKEKVKFKGAIAEGLPVPFRDALTMPTRAEAIGSIIAMVLSPASQIVSQIMGPASQVASQIQTIAEKTPAEAAPEPAAAPAT